jgi:hypothetical protein
MKFKDIKERFENGGIVKVYFGTQKTLYSIENENITYVQFQKLLKEYPQEKVNFLGHWQGITKHYYTYKINNQ